MPAIIAHSHPSEIHYLMDERCDRSGGLAEEGDDLAASTAHRARHLSHVAGLPLLPAHRRREGRLEQSRLPRPEGDAGARKRAAAWAAQHGDEVFERDAEEPVRKQAQAGGGWTGAA